MWNEDRSPLVKINQDKTILNLSDNATVSVEHRTLLFFFLCLEIVCVKLIVVLVDNDLITLTQSVRSILAITIDCDFCFCLTTTRIHNFLNSIIDFVGADTATQLLWKYNLNLRTIIPHLII